MILCVLVIVSIPELAVGVSLSKRFFTDFLFHDLYPLFRIERPLLFPIGNNRTYVLRLFYPNRIPDQPGLLV